MMADYIWIQMLQAITRASTAEQSKDIFYYADLLTDLDPDFYIAYKYAGLTIPWNYGRERWGNGQESTTILEKGLRHFPQDWYFRVQIAYNNIYFHKNGARAATMLKEASAITGSPPFAAPLATRLLAQAGQFDAALSLAESIRDSATDEATRSAFELRANEIRLERILHQLDQAAHAYEQRTGRKPLNLPELVFAGDLSDGPNDPLGGQLFFGSDGRAHSTVETQRLEVKSLVQDSIQP